ncbi:NAD(+) diphosphatase [Bailinhaonella thermotolerans]|uniref:NAD(+) diphosphatase n=1 Tax=Bailinhaonella thermotolerans TaxID=1070861 RepID=A0A3A4BA02_9ACTN|nr:NAD(+) diphosphatase [Bailinhaonella thermotolerans]
MPYSGRWLDRAPGRRTDPRWVNRILAAPSTRVIPMWNDRCLAKDDQPVSLTPSTLPEGAEPVLLGLDGDAGVFAADLTHLSEPDALALAAATATMDVRALVARLTPPEAGTLAYARGILHWARNQRYCGACGSPTESHHAGAARACQGCGKVLFPRIEPAVIALIEAPGDAGRCLLARHKGAPENAYSLLAGFVEIGESLEDAVCREIHEEAGVEVEDVVYQASQAWPFPAGLMTGFRARALGESIKVDPGELEEARWFTKPQAAALLTRQRPDSIGRYLLESWLQNPAAA